MSRIREPTSRRARPCCARLPRDRQARPVP
jgi:hypothetical protein